MLGQETPHVPRIVTCIRALCPTTRTLFSRLLLPGLGTFYLCLSVTIGFE
jgi:hypothetical protein